MSRLMQCSTVALAVTTAACSGEASAPTAPSSPPAAVIVAGSAAGPALAVSDSAIGFCYHPGTTRNCVFLSERIRITSTVKSLHWRASSDSPWLIVSGRWGTTPASLTISVDRARVPQPHGDYVRGAVTLRSAGATNSPLRVPVILYFIPLRR